MSSFCSRFVLINQLRRRQWWRKSTKAWFERNGFLLRKNRMNFDCLEKSLSKLKDFNFLPLVRALRVRTALMHIPLSRMRSSSHPRHSNVSESHLIQPEALHFVEKSNPSFCQSLKSWIYSYWWNRHCSKTSHRLFFWRKRCIELQGQGTKFEFETWFSTLKHTILDTVWWYRKQEEKL